MPSGEEDNHRKVLHTVLRIGAGLLAFLICIQLFLSFYVTPRLGNRLKDTVEKYSDGRMQLAYEDLDLRLPGRSITLSGFALMPAGHEKADSSVTGIRAKSLELNGIGVLLFFFNQTISIRNVGLDHPTLRLKKGGANYFSRNDSAGGTGRENPFPTVRVGEFQIRNGTVQVIQPEDTSLLAEIEQVALKLTELRADSSSLSTAPYFSFEGLNAGTGNISWNVSDDFYDLNVKKLEFSEKDEHFSLDSLTLEPRYPKYEFSRMRGHEVDRIELSIPHLSLIRLDYSRLMALELDADKLVIEGSNLEVFHDKKMPSGPKSKNQLPHMVFKDLDLPVRIDTVSLRETDITYSEHLQGVSKAGSISFLNLAATLYGVNNDSTATGRDHAITMDAQTALMGNSTLEVHARLPLYEDGFHTVEGNLDSMKISELNPMLEPVGLIRAESGVIHSLTFAMKMGAGKAEGSVLLKYSDLEVGILDKSHVKGDDSKQIISFLANVLKIKDSNNSKPFREGEVSFERLPGKSIFNYWWKSLADGLKNSIGL